VQLSRQVKHFADLPREARFATGNHIKLIVRQFQSLVDTHGQLDGTLLGALRGIRIRVGERGSFNCRLLKVYAHDVNVDWLEKPS